MKRTYTWAARPARRNLTVADLRAGKGKQVFTQVTANTAEEAAAAAAAGIDLIICNSRNVEAARAGNDELFLTAAMSLPDFPTPDDVLREAFRALGAGADAVMTARSMDVVAMLAKEEIPVMGHLGLVPRKSTWVGGLRAIGGTAGEAFQLFERFRHLEEAGACMVEAEVIPAPVMAAISERSGLITVSLGSGTGADVMYLFMEDICGDSENPPRHARAYGDLAALHRRLREERVAALEAFRADAMSGAFPAAEQTADIDAAELERFLQCLENRGPAS